MVDLGKSAFISFSSSFLRHPILRFQQAQTSNDIFQHDQGLSAKDDVEFH
jgi:hypothetical protein